jgi:hypothetical protein
MHSRLDRVAAVESVRHRSTEPQFETGRRTWHRDRARRNGQEAAGHRLHPRRSGPSGPMEGSGRGRVSRFTAASLITGHTMLTCSHRWRLDGALTTPPTDILISEHSSRSRVICPTAGVERLVHILSRLFRPSLREWSSICPTNRRGSKDTDTALALGHNRV